MGRFIGTTTGRARIPSRVRRGSGGVLIMLFSVGCEGVRPRRRRRWPTSGVPRDQRDIFPCNADAAAGDVEARGTKAGSDRLRDAMPPVRRRTADARERGGAGPPGVCACAGSATGAVVSVAVTPAVRRPPGAGHQRARAAPDEGVEQALELGRRGRPGAVQAWALTREGVRAVERENMQVNLEVECRSEPLAGIAAAILLHVRHPRRSDERHDTDLLAAARHRHRSLAASDLPGLTAPARHSIRNLIYLKCDQRPCATLPASPRRMEGDPGPR